MAVAYETSLAPTSVSFLAAGEAETVAFDAGSGANRVLLVCVSWRDQDNTISGVTYNGVAMTALGPKVELNDFSAQLWRLASPASGSNNIVVTMGAGLANSQAQIAAWVGNGADTAGTVVDGYQSNSGSASTANQVSSHAAIASAVGDMVVTFHSSFNVTDNLTAQETNYTERQDAANGGGLSCQFGDAAGAASVSPSATWSNGAFTITWLALGLNVNAAGGGGGGAVIPKFMAQYRRRWK